MRGALGEEPRRRRARERRLGVAAVARRVPAHRPIDDDGDVRFDDGRERVAVDAADRAGIDADPRPRRNRHLVRDRGAARAQEAELHVRRVRRQVQRGQPRREERVRHAFGEEAPLEAARVRAGGALGGVAHAVAVGIACRAVHAGRAAGIEAEGRLPAVGQAVAVAVDDHRRRPAQLHDLELVGAQAVEGRHEVVHRRFPARIGRSGDVHVAAVVGDDQPVGLHRLEHALQRRRVARDVRRWPSCAGARPSAARWLLLPARCEAGKT